MDLDKLRAIDKAEVRNLKYRRELLLTSCRASMIAWVSAQTLNGGVAPIAVVSPARL